MDNLKVPIMWSRQEAHEKTGLSLDALRNLCVTNKIKYVKVGAKCSKYLINAESLISWLNSGVGGDAGEHGSITES